jgi:predicted metal-dependent hydrolase
MQRNPQERSMQSSATPDTSRPRTSTAIRGIELAPRRMHWDFSAVPVGVCADDPDLSAFLLMLSAVAPAFERWAIPIAREHQPRVQTPALKREISAFIGQEAHHAAGHEQLNAAVFGGHGLQLDAVQNEIDRVLGTTSRYDAQTRLAIVAAAEHLLFGIADWYVRADDIHRRLHPEVHRLFLWHALEEIEHTSVAYDAYLEIYGTSAHAWWRRTRAMLIVSQLLPAAFHAIWKDLRRQILPRMHGARRGTLWPALVAIGKRAGFYAAFYLPHHKPWSNDRNLQLLPALRAQMSKTP